ncbi:MAG: putative amidohydrolase YtcJ [Sphingobacteriales bacterium]|jgi:predicted amidohydrolase YtcJ
MKKLVPILIFLLAAFAACNSKQKVETIYHNGVVYTVDSAFTIVEAFAVNKGEIVGTGTKSDLVEQFLTEKLIDLEGKAVYPGLFDAHGHFFYYGLGAFTVDLTGSKSVEELVSRTQVFFADKPVSAINGRGWDQNLWGGTFPTNELLNKTFPNTPVALSRVDGHAVLFNDYALKLANITPETIIDGGKVILKNGKVTGVLIDNAISLVMSLFPKPTRTQEIAAIMEAQRQTLAFGLTTIDDAGLMANEIWLIDSLHKSGDLKTQLYIMLDQDSANLDSFLDKPPYKTNRINVSSVKVYGDGALGSRGACLLEPYSDRPDEHGFNLSSPEFYKKLATRIEKTEFQMNTHCIGDSANRLLLNIYKEALNGASDRRWRIEHAQVVSDQDFELFKEVGVIASVQATHATSDMYWAEERLGPDRIKNAYAYKRLSDYTVVCLGSDAPVESFNPLYGFYAATARQDAELFPNGGFNMANALSREEALRGMTINAAYANFEENEKGSLEAGKNADFVILEKDIMKIPIRETRDTRVLATYIHGKKEFSLELE